MISKSYQKFTTFPTGDYSVFFMEDFLRNKDSSEDIIGQSPYGEHCEFCDIESAVIDFYTQGCKGCRIIGVSGFRHKRLTRPFSVYEECVQLVRALALATHCTILTQAQCIWASWQYGHTMRAKGSLANHSAIFCPLALPFSGNNCRRSPRFTRIFVSWYFRSF